MSDKPAAEKPTKVMSWKEFYKKTDDADKLMNRVWYCIGKSMFIEVYAIVRSAHAIHANTQ